MRRPVRFGAVGQLKKMKNYARTVESLAAIWCVGVGIGVRNVKTTAATRPKNEKRMNASNNKKLAI